ncbi:MAG: alpha/beta hydrolase [Pseudomonadota bacterium]
MDWTQVTGWDDAYDNRGNTPGWEDIPPRWARDAAAYRETLTAAGRARLDIPYGDAEREKLDLFLPDGAPAGLVVFIHGGYWRSFHRTDWSHYAAGAVDRGWAVAMPSYTLAPDARIAEITRQMSTALNRVAREIAGPIRLMGHSAGGHLAARMICTDTRVAPEVLDRVEHVMPISCLADLRPLLELAANAEFFRMDEMEAATESPALHTPVGRMRVTVWVGGDERPEFIRQSELLANVWTGFGLATRFVNDPGHNHFTVIDALAEAESAITAALFD